MAVYIYNDREWLSEFCCVTKLKIEHQPFSASMLLLFLSSLSFGGWCLQFKAHTAHGQGLNLQSMLQRRPWGEVWLRCSKPGWKRGLIESSKWDYFSFCTTPTLLTWGQRCKWSTTSTRENEGEWWAGRRFVDERKGRKFYLNTQSSAWANRRMTQTVNPEARTFSPQAVVASRVHIVQFALKACNQW